MNGNLQQGKNELEREVQGLITSEPRAAEIGAAGERVWRRLAGAAPAAAAAAAKQQPVLDCAEFVAMMAAYRARQLPGPQRELFEDHVRNCVACRRVLWQRAVAAGPARPELDRPAAWKRWAAAAAVAAAGVAVASFGVLDRVLAPGEQARTVAERVDGTLFRLDGAQPAAVRATDPITAGETVRTGRGSRAVLRLADGSRIEVNEHSELAVRARRSGAVIDLQRGSVIVEAAKQTGGRRLLVAAPDCEVAVKGTIFAVSHGPKGSRVAVAEGEVWVEHGGAVTKLLPGQQTATQANIAPIPVGEEFAWSVDRERYAALFHELAEVSNEMAARLAAVPARHESRLLPLVPADTFVYAAAPNVSDELAGAGEDLLGRIESNPQLAEWFAAHRQANPDAPDIGEALARFRELGAGVGEELVVAVAGAPAEHQARFLLLAEVKDQAGLRSAIESGLQRVRSECGEEIPVVLVDDPAALSEASRHLLVWVGSSVAVASNGAAEIARVAAAAAGGASEFAGTPFHAQLTRSYAEGVTWLFAADLARVTAGDPDVQVAPELGLADVRYLIAEQKHTEAGSQLRGVLTFANERRGVPAWLGAPAAMGALEFVSPNAYVAGCLLAKEPRAIADEVLDAIREHDPDGFGRLIAFEQEHGVTVRDDLAGPLGGELLFAIDGPVLPAPAWRVVVLIEDQSRLQATIATLVADLNRHLAAEGRPSVTLDRATEDGRAYFRLAGGGGPLELHYTFAHGYWLLSPDRAGLTEALRVHDSGLTLAASAEFRRALPVDGQEQYSALLYVNSGKLGAALASAIPAGAAAAQPALGNLEKLLGNQSTMALAATAERDRIVLTATGLDLLNPGPLLEAIAGRMPGAS